MYLPRTLLAHLYSHLLRTVHPLSPPVLILVALEPDALCACRILTALLRRDYIPHKIQPVAGYGDLARVGDELVQPMRIQEGGSGGVVVCLGVGGLVDLSAALGLDSEEEGNTAHGVEVWVVDARRPWNLENVFGSLQSAGLEDGRERREAGVEQGKISRDYRPGKGGVVVFDDGDIEEELQAEKEAFLALQDMPDVDEEENDDDGDDTESEDGNADGLDSGSRKRKSWSDREEDQSGSEDENGRPARRRRSNSSSPIPTSPSRPPRRGLLTTSQKTSSEPVFSLSASPPSNQQSSAPITTTTAKAPSARTLRRRLLKLRRKHENVLRAYYALGTSYSEPISSLLYSLASELGREDNDLLWLTIVGVSSTDLYGRTMSPSARATSTPNEKGERINRILRDEVRRLNPIPPADLMRERDISSSTGAMPIYARSPTDTSIRISPEPRFLLIRHWSLYDSMLHSPYLASRLHIWTDAGRRRLHKLLAKMGISLKEAGVGYTHMDIDLKRGLRERLLKFAPVYGLDGLVPDADSSRSGHEGWGFVRCWGWKACLSAVDVAIVVGAILEVGTSVLDNTHSHFPSTHGLPTPPTSAASSTDGDGAQEAEAAAAVASKDPDYTTTRFYAAYDALASSSPTDILAHIPTAQHLARAILRTGTALIAKHQIRHLRAFRMAVVKEAAGVGAEDVRLFAHPGALVKLALWVAEGVAVLEGEKGKRKAEALVLASLDEGRGVCVVVGLGGGGGRGVDYGREKERSEKKAKRDASKEAKRIEREKNKAEKKRLRAQRREKDDDAEDREKPEDEDEDDDEEPETEPDPDSDSSSDSDSDSDPDSSSTAMRKGIARNNFGNAFQAVVAETGARVKVDSFEHCVVEVLKEDLAGFLEALSLRSVVG
ncbi:CDC45 family [Cryomyces antarcticus]